MNTPFLRWMAKIFWGLFLIPLISAEPASPVPPASFTIVLQAEHLSPDRRKAVEILAASRRDWLIIDPWFTEGPQGRWTRAEIESLRKGWDRRQILAYLSIGEAENYRSYWDSRWDADQDGCPDPSAPAFLCQANPDWPGNYPVHYWDPTWQQIILRELEVLIAQGFDGVYLDIVDGFEGFEYDPITKDWIDHRRNPETGNTYREDMVVWVTQIAHQARQHKPGFTVIPQNGSQLLVDPGYRQTIDGIGIEGLFTCGDRFPQKSQIDRITGYPKPLHAERKPILLIEYGRTRQARNRAIQGATQNGFALLLTDRLLNTLGECPQPRRSTP